MAHFDQSCSCSRLQVTHTQSEHGDKKSGIDLINLAKFT